MSEEILGIFSAWVEKGKIISNLQWYKLIFTTNRIIVAYEKRSILNIAFSEALSAFSGVKKGPGYIFTQASARERMKMQESSAKLIENGLKANPENFEIIYSDITVVEAIPNPSPAYIRLHIFIESLDTPRYEFNIKSSRQYFNDIQKFLETVLPGKI